MRHVYVRVISMKSLDLIYMPDGKNYRDSPSKNILDSPMEVFPGNIRRIYQYIEICPL